MCSDTLPTYTGIAAKGYVHRLVQHDLREFRSRQGAHINGLEGFCGYLKRRLAAKGGIRPSRLPLYVAEYVWRYNHRRLSVDEQVHRLMNLLQNVLSLVAKVRLYPFYLTLGARGAHICEKPRLAKSASQTFLNTHYGGLLASNQLQPEDYGRCAQS